MSKYSVSNSSDKNIKLKGVRGAVLTFNGNPFIDDPENCYDYIEDGLIVIADGRIIDVGECKAVIGRNNPIDDIDVFHESVIVPGFIDCHCHYVQSSIIGSFGDKLIDWLNRYTFPAESTFRVYILSCTNDSVSFLVCSDLFSSSFESSDALI